MTSSSHSCGSSPPDGLFLRVFLTEGRVDEIYIHPGLTVGRSPANTIILEDETSIDRSHAEIRVGDDGALWLRCLEPEGEIRSGSFTTHEVRLVPGADFQIGQTRFECLRGERKCVTRTAPRSSGCPACGSEAIVSELNEPQYCGNCSEPFLAIPAHRVTNPPVYVPIQYGDYRAERFVARGGMGIVLKGIHSKGHRAVAIKIIPTADGEQFKSSERFEREIKAMSRVRDPCVVQLLGHGQSGNFQFLVMDWVEGRTLKDIIAERQRPGTSVAFETAIAWFTQVCQGLSALHAKGLIHRDLKPSNILIDLENRVRIADLGLARAADSPSEDLTATGFAPGTFAYMAPEQLNAPDTVDQRTDQFSLAVTFYELLTGDRPIGNWQPASTLNPTVPREFDAVIAKLLARQPHERYAHLGDVAAAVRAQASPPSIPAVPRTALVVAGGLVGCSVGTVVGLLSGINLLVAAIIGICPGVLIGGFTMTAKSPPTRITKGAGHESG